MKNDDTHDKKKTSSSLKDNTSFASSASFSSNQVNQVNSNQGDMQERLNQSRMKNSPLMSTMHSNMPSMAGGLSNANSSLGTDASLPKKEELVSDSLPSKQDSLPQETLLSKTIDKAPATTGLLPGVKKFFGRRRKSSSFFEDPSDEENGGSVRENPSHGTVHFKGLIMFFMRHPWFIVVVGVLILLIFIVIVAMASGYNPSVAAILNSNAYHEGNLESKYGFILQEDEDRDELEKRLYDEIESVWHKYKYGKEPDTPKLICEPYNLDINRILLAIVLFNGNGATDYFRQNYYPDDKVDLYLKPVTQAEYQKLLEEGNFFYQDSLEKIDWIARQQIITKYKDEAHFVGCAPDPEEWLDEKTSGTNKLVAQNDEAMHKPKYRGREFQSEELFDTWQDHAINERNYEYWFWESECYKDESGSCILDEDGKMDCDKREHKSYRLSTDYGDSVFYWNLKRERVLPDYYEGYMPPTEEEIYEKVDDIVEDIYREYDYIMQSDPSLSSGGSSGGSGSGPGGSYVDPDTIAKPDYTPAPGEMLAPLGNLDCRITEGYYGTFSHAGANYNPAIDLGFPWQQGQVTGKCDSNVPILAAFDGTVKLSYMGGGDPSTYQCGYAKVVHLTGDVGGKTYNVQYAHLSKWAVSDGQQVKQGDVLGYMGMSGWSTGFHVHLEYKVLEDGVWKYVDYDTLKDLFMNQYQCTGNFYE